MFLPSGHENETERWRPIDCERRRCCDFCTGSLTTRVSGSSPKMNVHFLPSHCFRLRLSIFIGISEYCGILRISHSSLQCWALLVWLFFFLFFFWGRTLKNGWLFKPALFTPLRRGQDKCEVGRIMASNAVPFDFVNSQSNTLWVFCNSEIVNFYVCSSQNSFCSG